MKTRFQLAALVMLFTSDARFSTAFAQGSLTPPGAPAPTMKTLTQVEPRTPISSVPFTISQSGSYYLTTNLTTAVSNAIVINASGVTLDLNGFTIRSSVVNAANGGMAILFGSGLSDITIANGHIRGGVTNDGGVYSGSGFRSGIFYTGTAPVNVRVSRISVSGCLYYGIRLEFGSSTVAENCAVRTVGSFGITASIINISSAIDCGTDAIVGDQVSDCYGQSSGTGTGVFALYTVQNCYGSNASGGAYGVYGYNVLNCTGYSTNSPGIGAVTAQNCFGTSSSGDGVSAMETAQNCRGSSTSGVGVRALAAQNCSGQSNNGIGIYASATASSCYGVSSTSDGINVGIAIGCYGFSTSGVGLRASLANSSYGSSAIIGNKYNMP